MVKGFGICLRVLIFFLRFEVLGFGLGFAAGDLGIWLWDWGLGNMDLS